MIKLKALYVSIHSLENESDGISKKINSQISALEEIGDSVDRAYISNGQIKLIVAGVPSIHSISAANKLFFFWLLYEILSRKLIYDFVYIRNPQGGFVCLGLPVFCMFIKQMAKVVIEVPTYPYDMEMNSLRSKASLVFHRFIRFFLPKYVDLISYMGRPVDKIWRINAFQLKNGVNPSDIYFPKKSIKPGLVRFIGVADLNYWHGYDRLIKSIYSYLKTSDRVSYAVEFHIVGDGDPELERLKNLVNELSLSGVVFFHGRKNFAELADLYSISQIGVDSLARHRSGVSYNCSIKSKEYFLQNLPIIKSHDDISVEETRFCYTVPATEGLLDIKSLLNWYQSLGDFHDEIRCYALCHFTWRTQMYSLRNKLWSE